MQVEDVFLERVANGNVSMDELRMLTFLEIPSLQVEVVENVVTYTFKDNTGDKWQAKATRKATEETFFLLRRF